MIDLGLLVRASAAAGLLTIAIATPLRAAHACACCSDPGERYDRVEVIDDYSGGVLKALRFGSNANLYCTAADWSEQVKGIKNPKEACSYELNVGRTIQKLSFEMSDRQGHKGRLTFMLPLEVHKFHAHTKPEIRKGAGYVPTVLYKEWRLMGVITGDGMFTFKQPAKAQLIFHGKGNGCTSEDQFTNWTLEAAEQGVRFRFFGRLAAPPQ